MRLLLSILLFLTFSLPSIALTLKEKFIRAQPGDYIATEQGKNYSLLFVRAISSNNIILEEITIPVDKIDLKKTSWQEWLHAHAPGNTSWIAYEIDFETSRLKESFSFTQNSWLYIQDSDYLLAKLLNLSLDYVYQKDRRRIGPAPQNSDEPDLRAIWNPPLIIERKKISKPKAHVWHGKWPDDGSILASCEVELYFDSTRPDFPFPFWIEIQSSHYALKVRTIDSGSGLTSPMPLLPHRMPIFLRPLNKKDNLFQFLIKTPSYYEKLNLYVIDLSSSSYAPILIPMTRKKIHDGGEILIEVEQKDLQKILIHGHSYRWIVIAEESAEGYAELDQTFLWN